MIPKGLSDKHFKRAAAKIDRYGVPADRKSDHYDLILNGKRYPPKYILSIATWFATGKEHPANHFNAVDTKNYFIRRGYLIIDRRTESQNFIIPENDESNFPEGKEQFRLHRVLERDNSISRKTKATRLAETGKLECESCGFDFASRYGLLGEGFIEAHHLTPVSKLNGKTKTKGVDPALVCSNCHRMLHRGVKLLTISELKTLTHKIVYH